MRFQVCFHQLSMKGIDILVHNMALIEPNYTLRGSNLNILNVFIVQ